MGWADRRQVVGAEVEDPLQGPPPVCLGAAPSPKAPCSLRWLQKGAQAAWRRSVRGGPPSPCFLSPACPNKATKTDDAALQFYFFTCW